MTKPVYQTPPSLSERQRLAYETILRQPTQGIASFGIHPMEWSMIERLAGEPAGAYQARPMETYRKMQEHIGCCTIDQWIWGNPLEMGAHGYDDRNTLPPSPTRGLTDFELDGIRISGPEDVVRHLETVAWPQLEKRIREFDPDRLIRDVVTFERQTQQEIGPNILKIPHGLLVFPQMNFYAYGYVPYFSAYALYPEIMERDFRLQADYGVLHNRALALVFTEHNVPPYMRIDFDIADNRSTLMDIRSLDRMWFPQLARCLQPLLDANVTMIWHCDGNLMEMVPRLLEVGIRGFQGFQYEAGMDYERICRMKDRDGESLLIVAGVSVTRTLPYGTPTDVKRELEWLVREGPERGLVLAGSSTITPGVPWENLKTLAEGMQHYRVHGRNG